MRPHQGRAEGEKNLPRPAGHAPLDGPRRPLALAPRARCFQTSGRREGRRRAGARGPRTALAGGSHARPKPAPADFGEAPGPPPAPPDAGACPEQEGLPGPPRGCSDRRLRRRLPGRDPPLPPRGPPGSAGPSRAAPAPPAGAAPSGGSAEGGELRWLRGPTPAGSQAPDPALGRGKASKGRSEKTCGLR